MWISRKEYDLIAKHLDLLERKVESLQTQWTKTPDPGYIVNLWSYVFDPRVEKNEISFQEAIGLILNHIGAKIEVVKAKPETYKIVKVKPSTKA